METNKRCNSGVRNTKKLYGDIVLFCLAFVFSLVTSAQGIAASYYVDGTNGNDSYAGSQAQPWKTIAKAGNTAKAGDTVLVRPGTYGESLAPANSGAAGNLITFKADVGCGCEGQRGETKAAGSCRVILDGQGSLGTGINLNGRQYIRVEGFEVRNFSGDGARFTPGSGLPPKISGVEIVGNYIHDCAGGVGIAVDYAQNALIQNNEIKNTRYGMFLSECRGLTVSGNNIHLINVDGVGLANESSTSYPCDIVFEYNRVYDAIFAGGDHEDAIQWWGHINGAIFRYNQISDFTQLLYVSTPVGGNSEVQNLQIYGNMFWNSLYWKNNQGETQGIFFDGRSDRGKFIKNVTIHSNTFGWTGYGAIWILDEAIDGVKMWNNIYYQGGIDITSGATNITANYNLYPTSENFSQYEGAGSLKTTISSVLVNYTGQNSTAFDFHLKAASPAIDRGDPQLGSQVTLPAQFLDADGNIRPFDVSGVGTSGAGAFDMGAYEYGAGGGGGNQPPTANAGPDQTVTDTDNNGSQQVTLNGSGSSDAGGSITNYAWKEGSTQIATGVSPAVTLAVGTHTITLTVTDNGGLTATDTVVITVQAPTNTPPTANAGPDQTVIDTDSNGSHQVVLYGSGSSDAGGSITNYAWKEGSTTIATGVSPAVTLAVGSHTITLTVTDNGGLTGTDTVVITVNTPANQSPTANAGPNQIVTDTDNSGSQQVTLNGSSSSDAGGSITNYAWKEGSTTIAIGVSPAVTMAVGSHTITLTVTDNGGLTASDTVVITVNTPANQSPTANAGPDQTVIDTDSNGSHQVVLYGSGSSDTDGNITSYVWTEGGTQIATGAVRIVTMVVGIHTITLTVTDNGGLTDTDTVVITVQVPANQTPNANAGPDRTVTDTDNNGSQQVGLNGSGSSDPNGSITSYVWKEGSTQLGTGAIRFVILSVGTHTITLTVTDNGGLTASDTVVIKVNAPNNAPIADAGPDQTVTDTDNNGRQRVYLNGSHSSDPNGSITSYVWREGSTQIASGAIRLVTLSVGTHTITLTVTDNRGLTATDTVVIKVNAPANLTLTSDQTVDDNSTDTAVMTVNATGAEAEVGLVGYWKFDDGSGLTAVDSSGSNLAGLLVNGPMWTTQGEISFDGSDDAVEVNTANMSVNNGTIALWVHPDGFTNSKHFLFGEATQPWSNRIQLYCDQSGALNLGMGDNPYLEPGIETLNAGEWYHIALTWDDTNYAVYVDGVQKATGTYSGLSSLATYADIGNNGNSSDRNEAFDGLIDEVSVYNIAIEAEEIANIALVFLPVDNKTVAAGDELSFTVRTKPGTIVSLDDSDLPGTPSFASNTFKWTPGDNDAGTYKVEFTASNGSLTSFESITITVTDDTPSPDTNVVGLVGYWKFDDNSGQTAADSSGSNLAGLLVNGPTWTGQGELSFDGSDDAVEVTMANMNADSGTIALWVRPDAFSSNKHFLFGEATQPWSNRIQLYCDQSGALNLGMGDNPYLETGIETLNAGEWYHIALTWDDTNYAVYVDGVQKATGTYSGLSSLANYADIGNNGNSSVRDEAFDGLIDEVQVYNIALTAEEIASSQ